MYNAAPRWSPARLAYWFYAVAATGAVIGQTWVALTHIPWGTGIPAWVRVAAVLPFALCLELLAMALAAMADERMRLGEGAYGFRIFSALVATVAVGILVLGHWPHYYWSAAFGVLSSSAYLLWLLHSAARRRDALRAAGKLADTAPDYGLWRRLRYPIWTARAAELAREGHIDQTTGAWRPLALYESLRAAQLAIRAEKRRPLVAKAVEQVVRGDHRDPKMADIAVRTLDLDRVATELESLVDYAAWADRLAPAITVPTASAAATPVIGDTAPAPHVRMTNTAPLAARYRSVARPRRVSVRRRRLDAARTASMRTTPQAPLTRVTSDADGSQPPMRLVNDAAVADTVHLGQFDAACREHDGAVEARTASPTSTAAENPANVPVPTNRLAPDRDAAVEQPAPPFDESRPRAEADTDATTDSARARSETAAAVAYWRDHNPQLRPADIAARIGKSTRQVQRILAALDKPEPLPRPNGALIPGPSRIIPLAKL